MSGVLLRTGIFRWFSPIFHKHVFIFHHAANIADSVTVRERIRREPTMRVSPTLAAEKTWKTTTALLLFIKAISKLHPEINSLLFQKKGSPN